MHVQRSETAPEVCHSSEVLDDPIFSSYASILDPACVVKVKGQVTPLASFHPWTRRADTHCQHTLAYFPYISLCAYCHANCIPVKEAALAVLSLEKTSDNRDIKMLWECIWYLHPDLIPPHLQPPVLCQSPKLDCARPTLIPPKPCLVHKVPDSCCPALVKDFVPWLFPYPPTQKGCTLRAARGGHRALPTNHPKPSVEGKLQMQLISNYQLITG